MAHSAGRKTGRIEAEHWADLLAINTSSITDVGSNGDVIIDNFIFAGDDRLVQEVWSAGRHVVTSGQHFAHDQITENYRSVLSAVKDWL